MKTSDARTISQLTTTLESAFQKKPYVSHIDYVDDYGNLLREHIYGPKNHTGPHAFKFETVNGKVIMYHKEWAQDHEWEMDGEILDDKSISSSIKLKSPSNNDFEEIRRKLKNKHTVSTLTTNEMKEWDDFLKKQEQRKLVWQKVNLAKTKNEYILMELGKQVAKKRKLTTQEEDIIEKGIQDRNIVVTTAHGTI